MKSILLLLTKLNLNLKEIVNAKYAIITIMLLLLLLHI